MAQHDYIIANQSGAAFRSDLNNGLAAIVSQNSGAAQPSTTYAYQWWADTTTGLLKLRNAANNAWITVGTLASANLGLIPAGAANIVNADISASAAIVDTKLATISTAAKVSNSATTATNANTASAIVARDASGNFTAGTITAALTGAASSNLLKAGDTMTGNITFDAAQPRVAMAWVNFNGTGTVAIRASYNVSSITDNGTGNYTVNFTTAMVDANYSAQVTAGNTVFADNAISSSYAAGSVVALSVRGDTGAAVDVDTMSVVIFR